MPIDLPADAPATIRPTATPWPSPLPLPLLSEGQDGQVVSVDAAGLPGEQLMEMGLTPGTRVRLVQRGAGGHCVQLELRGYTLVVRQAQAQHIGVVPLPTPHHREPIPVSAPTPSAGGLVASTQVSACMPRA